MGEDSLVVVNSIKRALNEYEREDTAEIQEERLRELLQEETQINQGLNRLAVQMAAEGNEEVLQLQEEVKNLEKEITESQRKILRLSTTD